MKFVDDFVSYCQDFTACPEIFLRWSAITTLSAVAGRKHAYMTGDWNIYPNLWTLILGNSSSYKSTGVNAAKRLLEQAWPAVFASQQYSHEALFEDLSIEPHRFFVYDEAETFLRMINSKYNLGMEPTMISLYNGQNMNRKIKGKTGHDPVIEIRNPYLCWLGASTQHQIAEAISGNSSGFLSGFWPRFIIVPFYGEEKSMLFPPPSDKIKAASLIAQLTSLMKVGEREYRYSDDAKRELLLWTSRYQDRLAKCDPMLGAFYKKQKDEHFHKLCILSAFERGSAVIDVQDVEFTIPLLWGIEKEWPSLLERFTEKEWDRDANRVEAFLRKAVETDREELLRKVRGIKAQKLTSILYGLEQDFKIKVTPQNTPGRPRSLIKWL
jgi:hypothetical protein